MDLPEPLQEPFARALPVLTMLHRNGVAHGAFAELARHQTALRRFSEALITVETDYARKLAGYSLGYLDDVGPEEFEGMLNLEVSRAKLNGFSEELNAQSTVEDLVFSAVRLIKDGRRPEVGLGFLERIVTDLVEERRYWNTSNYAMASLMNADPERYGDLFQKWSRRIDGPPPEHDSKPSFEPEREWRDFIKEGTTDQIFEMLTWEEEEAARMKLRADGRQVLDDLLQALEKAA
jgi:hypothetical protein